jgi:hypothetical protein
MATITIQYDDGRPDQQIEAAQFILFHVIKSDKVENLIMTTQCQYEFMRDSITEENAKEYLRQSFKGMSKKRLGDQNGS